jgi:hypothetical protein
MTAFAVSLAEGMFVEFVDSQVSESRPGNPRFVGNQAI